MSVPTHNLYDFIYQVTKKKYLLKYFSPWGSKDIDNIVDHIDTDKDVEEYNLQLETKKIFKEQSILFSWKNFQPILLCHDQEPLNFNLYNNYTLNLRHCQEKNGKIPTNYRKKWILLHSEKNSADLNLYKESGQFSLAHWWCHALISRDWFRFAKYDEKLQKQVANKKFLVYARECTGSRKYRKKFLKMIDSTMCQIGSFYKNDVNSELSAVYNAYDHSHTEMSIVLETVVDRVHLTEKTCRALACKHPFLLVAGAGSLDYLKHYGFKTFEGIIDESYDTEQDLEKRMSMVVQQMHIVKNFDSTRLNKLRKIAEYNHKRFFSKDFFDQVIAELKKNVSDAHSDELDIELLIKNFLDSSRKAQSPYLGTLIVHLKKGGTLEDYVPPDLD